MNIKSHTIQLVSKSYTTAIYKWTAFNSNLWVNQTWYVIRTGMSRPQARVAFYTIQPSNVDCQQFSWVHQDRERSSCLDLSCCVRLGVQCHSSSPPTIHVWSSTNTHIHKVTHSLLQWIINLVSNICLFYIGSHFLYPSYSTFFYISFMQIKNDYDPFVQVFKHLYTNIRDIIPTVQYT